MKRIVAVFTCLAILALSAPTTFAAQDNPLKFDFKIIKKPISWLASLFTFIPLLDAAKYAPQKSSSNYGGKIKITGDLSGNRTGGGD